MKQQLNKRQGGNKYMKNKTLSIFVGITLVLSLMVLGFAQVRAIVSIRKWRYNFNFTRICKFK